MSSLHPSPEVVHIPPWVEHAQPCEACRVLVHFRLCRGTPGFPDFVMPVWPDECWLGWKWSQDTPGKLDLQVLCSQSCLTEWFERPRPTDPALEGAPS